MVPLAEQLRERWERPEPWLLGTLGLPATNPDGAAADARAATHQIGSLVWCATDGDDLQDILDSAHDDERLRAMAMASIGSLMAGAFAEIRDGQSFIRAVVQRTDDPDLLSDLLEGLRVRAATGRLFRRPRPADAASIEELPLSMVPTPFLRGLLAGTAATVCFSALADLALYPHKPPAWLARAVVRKWVENERGFLRAMAACSDNTDIPTEILPADERLDRDTVAREHNDGEEVFEQFIAGSVAHRRS